MSAVKFSQVVQPEKAEEEDTKEKETPTERDTQTQSQLAQTWNSFHEVHWSPSLFGTFQLNINLYLQNRLNQTREVSWTSASLLFLMENHLSVSFCWVGCLPCRSLVRSYMDGQGSVARPTHTEAYVLCRDTWVPEVRCFTSQRICQKRSQWHPQDQISWHWRIGDDLWGSNQGVFESRSDSFGEALIEHVHSG